MKKLIFGLFIITNFLTFSSLVKISSNSAGDSKIYSQNNKREIEIILFDNLNKATLLLLIKKEYPRAIVLSADDFTITAYSAKGDKLMFIEDGSIAFIKNSDHLSNREALEITKQMLEDKMVKM